MAYTPAGADELTRLKAVQARVRTLARNYGWFGDAIRAAFVGYLSLGERFQSEKSAIHDRERLLARKLVAKGWLIDPKARDNSPCLFVRVKGLCPVTLADRLGKHRRGDMMPIELERDGAVAALAALNRDAIYQARNLPEKKREAMAVKYREALAAKTHVSFSWMIVVSRPNDWQEPANPHSLDRADLERFAIEDYLTIALYRLGGLADVGALRPIVAKPRSTGDMVRDMVAYAAWRSRFLIDDDVLDENQPLLSVRALPSNVAEQMLEDVEVWAKGEAAAQRETLIIRGPSVAPELLERLQHASTAIDDGEFDRVAERVPEVAVHLSCSDDNSEMKPTTFPSGDEEPSLALTLNQSRVLQVMALFDPARLLPSKMIEEEMDAAWRLSERTIGTTLLKLIDLQLAERPGGPRSGARLTMAGRRLAQKIAD